MYSFIKKLFFLFLRTLFLVATANAQFNLSPRGLRTGLLGSNGIALTSDTSAGVLNPASIAGLKGARLSASTSVAQLSRLTLASGSQVIDRNQEAQFGLSSGYIASFLNWGDLNLGVYAVEEASLKFTKYFEYRFMGATSAMGSSQLEIATVLNRIGLIIGKKLSRTVLGDLSLGMSPFLYLQESKNIQMGKVQSGVSNEINFNNLKREYAVFSLRLGFVFENESINFGGYLQPQGQLLSQFQTRYTARVTTTGDVEDYSNNNPSNETSPAQWGIGLQLQDVLGGSLVLDYSGWESVEYRDESLTEDSQETDATQKAERIGLGYRQDLNDDSSYGGGIQLTQLTDPQSGVVHDLHFVSLGREQKINFLNTYFNLFYSDYSSKSEGGSQLTNFGISIATEYSY